MEEGSGSGDTVHCSTESSSKYPDYCRTLTFKDASGQVRELVLPKALDLDRPKRARTIFSPDQLYQLEAEFCRNQYLVGRERTQLADRLQLSETQVKVWFQNRRTKYKKDKCRGDEEKQVGADGVGGIMRLLQPPPAPPTADPVTVTLPATSTPSSLPAGPYPLSVPAVSTTAAGYLYTGMDTLRQPIRPLPLGPAHPPALPALPAVAGIPGHGRPILGHPGLYGHGRYHIV